MKIAVCASGNLGYQCLLHLKKNFPIEVVLTDRQSQGIITFCEQENIPVYSGKPNNPSGIAFFTGFEVDVLLSLNYLFIIDAPIFKYAKKAAVNFHGSLLPKYRGRTPHVWAIINNEQYTGITAHIISEGCDEGDIVYQEKIAIGAADTGATILSRFQERYPAIIDEVMNRVVHNTINPVPQDHQVATYFGKRTPADGLINWDWQKERIYNWVRAQAKPYPGAFSFYENQKVIIHKVAFSDAGFHQDQPNGTVLDTTDGVVVKTPNGALLLLDVETHDGIIFNKGGIFHG